MNITKVKYDGSKVRIEYTVDRKDGGESDEYSVVSGDKPLPSFTDALQALSMAVADICELNREASSCIDVRGVTFTWKSDIMWACITGLKSLKTTNSPLVLNTPHLPESAYSGNPDDGSPCLPRAAAQLLYSVLEEAKRYLNGDRAQATLPLGTPTSDPQKGTA